MTQKELIEFCKENDPNYNKDASFKVMEPMWSIPKGIGGIGITESEFKNGFYVQIDTKGRKGFEDLEGEVFYFRNSNPSNAAGNMYNSHWKKYFVPLNDMMSWSREIVKNSPKPILTEDDPLIALCVASHIENGGKGILEQIEPSIKVEEFPIVKESVETWYKKRNVRISVRKNLDDMFSISISNDMYTSEEFSDLVDLMIEARKDLLK